MEIADRIEVLRLGQQVGHVPAQGTNVEDFVAEVTGADSRSASNAHQ